MEERNHIDYNMIGQRVYQRRRAMGLTQSELAKLTGVSSSFIGHIERAEKAASLDTMAQLSEALKVSLDWLVQGRRMSCNGARCPLYDELAVLLRSYGLGDGVKDGP